MENPLRGPGPRRCAPRACYVCICAAPQCATAGPIRTRAYVATAGPAKPVTHRLLDTNTSLRDTDSNTKRGPCTRIVRTGTPSSGHPSASVSSPFLLQRSSPSPFSSLPYFVPFSVSFFLSIYLSLPATSALTSLRQTREYAQSSNRAYCQGYTPINPEVPSNGQLENRLGFPRNHPARPPRPLASSRDKRTIDYRVLLRFQLFLWYTSTCAFWRRVVKHKCDNYERMIRSHLSTE